MQLAPGSETIVSESDYSWLGNGAALGMGRPRTFHTADMTEAAHYPNGRLLPGMFVAKYTAGARNGLWGPYVDDWSDVTNTGLDTIAGILLDGGEIKKDRDGALVSTRTVASVLILNLPVVIKLGNLPAMVLEDGTTAFTPDAADITALGMINDDEGQTF